MKRKKGIKSRDDCNEDKERRKQELNQGRKRKKIKRK